MWWDGTGWDLTAQRSASHHITPPIQSVRYLRQAWGDHCYAFFLRGFRGIKIGWKLNTTAVHLSVSTAENLHACAIYIPVKKKPSHGNWVIWLLFFLSRYRDRCEEQLFMRNILRSINLLPYRIVSYHIISHFSDIVEFHTSLSPDRTRPKQISLSFSGSLSHGQFAGMDRPKTPDRTTCNRDSCLSIGISDRYNVIVTVLCNESWIQWIQCVILYPVPTLWVIYVYFHILCGPAIDIWLGETAKLGN